MLPAVTQVREAAGRVKDSNNLKQIGLAMHNFHSARNRFPQATAFRTKDGQPGLSWRVALLPFLEEENLYRQFKLDEPWDSPANRPLLARIPKVYLQPDQVGDTSGNTHYLVFTGQGAMFDDPLKPNPNRPPVPAGQPELGVGIAEVVDGTSNTILVVTAPNAVPWTKPDDLAYNPGAPLPPLVAPGRRGFNALFADGSVRQLTPNLPEPTLRGMITRNGGEAVVLP